MLGLRHQAPRFSIWTSVEEVLKRNRPKIEYKVVINLLLKYLRVRLPFLGANNINFLALRSPHPIGELHIVRYSGT